MAEPEPRAHETFATRLRRLFEAVRREDGRPFSKQDVADAIGVSKSYIYDLLNGKSDPGHEIVLKIVDFFSVDLEYFSRSRRGAELNRQYELLARLGENNVRQIAARAVGLSPDKLRSVLEYMDFQARRDPDDTSE
ncbi:helix-turn-helix transcriptional regulator [Amycolatopsis taiwanensis]|uniref:HTH cro/C1-type domain-containing protein n=1 Tax=Amycolatopsis taiwanensis TaxID=342230 RepID=A0A9W6R439_9PSEU|nr:helix-turn-helix transcriptional regulator [Amycolatopsis taiwanensis]GLY68759.1 hypothetical protein Atai01_53780 [Amycolatopsis taiwanensis]